MAATSVLSAQDSACPKQMPPILRALLRFDDKLSQKVDRIKDSQFRTSASKLFRVIISGIHDV
jgi:hypothetical protein